MALHISIAAEPIFHLGSVPITNSIFTSWLVTLGLVLFALVFGSKLKSIKYNDKPSSLQSLVEMIIGSLYDLVHGIVGSPKKSLVFFPFIATFFLFIMLSNWSGLLPGVGSIGFSEHETSLSEEAEVKPPVFVPYFRAPTADINTTLALAIFSVLTIQVFGTKFLHLGYFKKFFNFSSPILFAVGLLELVSEFSKIISFAFRLFGNIFAGEVLLVVISFLIPALLPIPFYGLELFVGFIQALVFSLLTLVFLNVATMGHGDEAH